MVVKSTWYNTGTYWWDEDDEGGVNNEEVYKELQALKQEKKILDKSFTSDGTIESLNKVRDKMSKTKRHEKLVEWNRQCLVEQEIIKTKSESEENIALEKEPAK